MMHGNCRTSKQVLILLGSPRKTGNSAVLAQQLADGAEHSGAIVTTLYLHGMNISPCTGCNSCQGVDATGCVLDDDMQKIYDRLRDADSIVFAGPIYWFSVTAQTKMVIDRIYAVGGGDKNILKGKEFGILLSYADSDPFTSGAVNALRMFQDIAAYLGVRIAGAVYGSAYEAGKIRNSAEVLKSARELGMKMGEGSRD